MGLIRKLLMYDCGGLWQCAVGLIPREEGARYVSSLLLSVCVWEGVRGCGEAV